MTIRGSGTTIIADFESDVAIINSNWPEGLVVFCKDTNKRYTLVGGVWRLFDNIGIALLDFGAFPGSSSASVDVTGQTYILAGSVIFSWIFPLATVDHSADEHWIEPIKVLAGNTVPGTGFTIYGVYAGQDGFPDVSVGEYGLAKRGLGGARLYGKYTIGWRWD